MSRVHAILEVKDAHTFLIIDQGSSNKSWRNSIQLEPHVRYACENRDHLTFGEVKMRLTVKGQAEEEELEEEEQPYMAATQMMATGT